MHIYIYICSTMSMLTIRSTIHMCNHEEYVRGSVLDLQNAEANELKSTHGHTIELLARPT